MNSRVAQWKRAGPITQRSVDRNYALLEFFSSNCFFQTSRISVQVYLYKVTFAASNHHDPLAQRIARWTSNPKVLGSIPRWDDDILFDRNLIYNTHFLDVHALLAKNTLLY